MVKWSKSDVTPGDRYIGLRVNLGRGQEVKGQWSEIKRSTIKGQMAKVNGRDLYLGQGHGHVVI